MKRFSRNQDTITLEQQEVLASKKILVVGLGGLGSHIIEGLARIGFMHIGICDYDIVEETNLNRQLLALESNLGVSKCELAKERIHSINTMIKVVVYDEKYPNKKLLNDLKTYDLIIDCLDSIKTRKQLEIDCLKLNKQLVYGTIAGNYGTLV